MSDDLFVDEYDSNFDLITETKDSYISEDEDRVGTDSVYKPDKPYRSIIRAKITHD